MTVEWGGKSFGSARYRHSAASTCWKNQGPAGSVWRRRFERPCPGDHGFGNRAFLVCQIGFIVSAVTSIILTCGPVPEARDIPGCVVTILEYHVGLLTTFFGDQMLMQGYFNAGGSGH